MTASAPTERLTHGRARRMLDISRRDRVAAPSCHHSTRHSVRLAGGGGGAWLYAGRMEGTREYEVVLSPEDEGGFSVFVPELPSVATQGETREEALAMAKEAIEGYLEAKQEDGLPIPRVERGRVAVGA